MIQTTHHDLAQPAPPRGLAISHGTFQKKARILPFVTATQVDPAVLRLGCPIREVELTFRCLRLFQIANVRLYPGMQGRIMLM